MHREDYDYATGSYEAPIFEEFGTNGELRGMTSTPDPSGRYRLDVVPGNSEDELFHYACNSSALAHDQFQRRNHDNIFYVDNPVSAFQNAEILMIELHGAAK